MDIEDCTGVTDLSNIVRVYYQCYIRGCTSLRKIGDVSLDTLVMDSSVPIPVFDLLSLDLSKRLIYNDHKTYLDYGAVILKYINAVMNREMRLSQAKMKLQDKLVDVGAGHLVQLRR